MFHPVKVLIYSLTIQARAAALFDALDADGSGEIDDEEFIAGNFVDNLADLVSLQLISA